MKYRDDLLSCSYKSPMLSSALPQLHIFLTVARLRSFSGAARELGVSPSAVSQAIRQLEEQIRVVLFNRTTRSVALTDAGKRLADSAEPAVRHALAALTEASARPGETVGRLRLSVPNVAVPYVVEPLLPAFRRQHPRIEVEVVAEDRFVDIVAEGYDAGIRLAEAIERDMVQLRLTKPFRFVVVASPAYLERNGTPARPEDLLRHECLTFRSASTGAPYAWELERGRRNWRVPVRGGVLTNDSRLRLALAEQDVGLTYAFEPMAYSALRSGRLRCVLEPYAAKVPGFFLYYPSRSQSSPALRLFVEVAKTISLQGTRP